MFPFLEHICKKVYVFPRTKDLLGTTEQLFISKEQEHVLKADNLAFFCFTINFINSKHLCGCATAFLGQNSTRDSSGGLSCRRGAWVPALPDSLRFRGLNPSSVPEIKQENCGTGCVIDLSGTEWCYVQRWGTVILLGRGASLHLAGSFKMWSLEYQPPAGDKTRENYGVRHANSLGTGRVRTGI